MNNKPASDAVTILREALVKARIGLRDWEIRECRYAAIGAIDAALAGTDLAAIQPAGDWLGEVAAYNQKTGAQISQADAEFILGLATPIAIPSGRASIIQTQASGAYTDEAEQFVTLLSKFRHASIGQPVVAAFNALASHIDAWRAAIQPASDAPSFGEIIHSFILPADHAHLSLCEKVYALGLAAAPTAHVQHDASHIPTWETRVAEFDSASFGEPDPEAFKEAEIADLRAALAAREAKAAPVATVVSQSGNDLRVGWLRPELCKVGDMLYAAPVSESTAAPGVLDRMTRLGQYVTDFAVKAGWKPDGEGAFEFIQRHSYTVGIEDAGGKVGKFGTQTNGSRWPITAFAPPPATVSNASIGEDEKFKMLLGRYYLSDEDTEAMGIEREIFAYIDARPAVGMVADDVSVRDALNSSVTTVLKHHNLLDGVVRADLVEAAIRALRAPIGADQAPK